MKHRNSFKPTGNVNIGVVILSDDYRVIGINRYASEVLNFDPSRIGQSVYKYHPSKVHSRIKHLLTMACKKDEDVPIIMNVLGRVLAVNLCRIELKDAHLKSSFVMTFVDVTGQKDSRPGHVIKSMVKRIPVFERGAYLFLNPSSVCIVKCEGNYCRVFTQEEQFCLRITLEDVEKRCLNDKFVRVHRSFLVNPESVYKIFKNTKGQTIIDFNNKNIPSVPVARRKVHEIKNILRLVKDHPETD